MELTLLTFKYLPCEEVRGRVEDFIAGFGGLESTAEY